MYVDIRICILFIYVDLLVHGEFNNPFSLSYFIIFMLVFDTWTRILFHMPVSP